MKEFNVTGGVCVLGKHYRVNIEGKLFEIMEMAHKGNYFAINRARQYDQLIGYMKAKGVDKGYLVIFDLRKEGNKEQKAELVQIGDRQIFEVVV